MKINLDDTRFLNSQEDVNHRDIVTIDSEGKWQESNFKDEDGNPQNEFRINFVLESGETRSTTLRSTNVRLLGGAFGDETKEWIGKKVRAWKTKSEKAKAGYVFVFAPVDYERDDTGEWIIPKKEEVDDTESIDPDDIPF